MRSADGHPGGRLTRLPARLAGRVVHRLLDEEHRAGGGEATQEVLRALKDEVPAEVGEDDQGARRWHSVLGGWRRITGTGEGSERPSRPTEGVRQPVVR